MRFEVFDVAADGGGALTILREFYEAAVREVEHEWVFHVSKPRLLETKNVRVLNHPWVKTSWIHRLYFEAIADRFVRRHNADVVVSLQNLTIWRSRPKQVIYVHQSLPYADERYRLFKEPKLWAYQNVISRLVHRSMNNAHMIIVQSRWMKEAILENDGIPPDKIIVIPPVPVTEGGARQYSLTREVRRHFFYPSSLRPYKNHQIIVEACRLLHEKSINEFRVRLTVRPGSIEPLKGESLACIYTSGPLLFEEVQRLYSQTVLIYPSKLESYGLPLAEAKRTGALILAADTPVGREILQDYPNAHLFASDDASALARLMEAVIDGTLRYVPLDPRPVNGPETRSLLIEAVVSLGDRS